MPTGSIISLQTGNSQKQISVYFDQAKQADEM